MGFVQQGWVKESRLEGAPTQRNALSQCHWPLG